MGTQSNPAEQQTPTQRTGDSWEVMEEHGWWGTKWEWGHSGISAEPGADQCRGKIQGDEVKQPGQFQKNSGAMKKPPLALFCPRGKLRHKVSCSKSQGQAGRRAAGSRLSADSVSFTWGRSL
jgi:hypothetical protein